MDFILALVLTALRRTAVTFTHNWPFLLTSILIAAALKLFLDADGASAFLRRFRGAGVAAATAVAVTTPLCSCGTTAVVLGMMAGSMPLGPIVAFMVASPLSSPSQLFYSAGLFGWPFALAYFGATILLGLAGGAVANVLEARGWLKGQIRFAATASPSEAGCGCRAPDAPVAAPAPLLSEVGCGCGAPLAPALAPTPLPAGLGCGCAAPAAPAPVAAPVAARPFVEMLQRYLRLVASVAGRLVPLFAGFAFVGYFLNGIIPAAWIQGLFGEGRAYGVPLAATLGLPLYVSSEASMPLVRALVESGMSRGAIAAFLVAGAGTSVGAIAGALTIARRRVVGLVIAVLWLGAILVGWGMDAFAAFGLI